MKNYFNEVERLSVVHATENPHRPKVNAKGNVVGFERHDITLYFEPVDEAMKNAIGTLEIQTGADEITWGYGMNTKRYPTYGGEVVQILSTYADKMSIRGTCLEYKTLTRIYEYFKDYLLYTTGGASILTGNDRDALERKQKFLKFTYPARKWSFVIMIAEANGFRIARDIAAPQWEITAEIVSENDRYRMGSERIDRFANVLATPVSTGGRGSSGSAGRRTKRSPESITSSGQEEDTDVLKLPKNFQIERAGDPFGNLMDFANGKRGKIAENFHALIANWATGDVSTVFNNPLVDPEKTEDQIWTEKFGSLEMSGGVPGATGDGSTGTGGGGTPVGDPATGEGIIVWGEKKRVFATAFGGAGDDNGLGSGGKILKDFPDSYAELSTNMYNSANGKPADGKNNDYAALGKLPYETPIRVTYKGKSKTLYKRDTGFGGKGPDGKRGTADDPKIDIWHTAAKELGFGGFDWVEIEIGTVSAGSSPDGVPGSAPPDMTSDVRANAVAWANWMYQNRKNVVYEFGGGHGGVDTAKRTKAPGLPLHLDCSSSTSLCLMWGGAKQIGIQSTATMINFQKINRKDCGPGDLVIYGDSVSDTHHVSMIIKREGDKLICFNHGGGTAEDAKDPLASPNIREDNYRDDIVAYVRWPGLK
jgi:hypothetical protein